MLLGQPQQAAFERIEVTVDAIELIDEFLDAAVVQANDIHSLKQFFLELRVPLLLRRAQRIALENGLHPHILQPLDLLIRGSDLVESVEHVRLEHGFHRRKRQRDLVIIVVAVLFGFLFLVFRILG